MIVTTFHFFENDKDKITKLNLETGLFLKIVVYFSFLENIKLQNQIIYKIYD